jgi:hypothetical protein
MAKNNKSISMYSYLFASANGGCSKVSRTPRTFAYMAFIGHKWPHTIHIRLRYRKGCLILYRTPHHYDKKLTMRLISRPLASVYGLPWGPV